MISCTVLFWEYLACEDVLCIRARVSRSAVLCSTGIFVAQEVCPVPVILNLTTGQAPLLATSVESSRTLRLPTMREKCLGKVP